MPINRHPQYQASSEEEARLVLFAIQDFTSMFFLMRPDGSFIFVNNTTCETLGYDQEQLLHMRVPDIDPSYPEDRWQELWQSIQKEGTVVIQSQLITKEQQFIPVEIRLQQQKYGDNTFCTAFAEDISWRLRSEQELKRARDAALEATRLKSEFLANMSHEIRTPMNGMLGMARLLLHTPLNGHQREFTRHILESGEQLAEIIGEVLDFSKIESGKLELNEVSFDPIDLIEKVASLFTNQVSSDVELSFTTPSHIPFCLGDPLRIRQIISNLLSNAIKFTPAGSISVKVDCTEETDLEQVLSFCVSDTGIGIEAKALEAIFQPFTQADGSVARKYGGTGLGLTICQQLLSMMNSKLEVDTEPDQGTSMRFQLRLHKHHETTPKTAPLELKNISRIYVAECNSLSFDNFKNQLHYFDISEQTTSLTDSVSTNGQHQRLLFTGTKPWLEHPQHWQQLAAQYRIVLLTTGEPQEEIPGNEHIERFVRMPITRSRLKQLLLSMDNSKHLDPMSSIDEFSAVAQLNLSVLVVEDNYINCELFKYLLKGLGCHSTIVGNGKLALEQLQNRRFDAILMDCHLPEMDGFTAARKIRQLKGINQQVPIIAVSADATADARQRCLDSGMNDYITKPIMGGALRQLLDKWVPNESPSTPQREPVPDGNIEIPGIDMNIISMLQQMKNSSGNLLSSFTASLAKEVPSTIKQLNDAAQRQAYVEIADLAHQFKGSFGVLGATDAQALCQELRQAAKRHADSKCDYLLHDLQKEAERVVEMLRNYQSIY